MGGRCDRAGFPGPHPQMAEPFKPTAFRGCVVLARVAQHRRWSHGITALGGMLIYTHIHIDVRYRNTKFLLHILLCISICTHTRATPSHIHIHAHTPQAKALQRYTAKKAAQQRRRSESPVPPVTPCRSLLFFYSPAAHLPRPEGVTHPLGLSRQSTWTGPTSGRGDEGGRTTGGRGRVYGVPPFSFPTRPRTLRHSRDNPTLCACVYSSRV